MFYLFIIILFKQIIQYFFKHFIFISYSHNSHDGTLSKLRCVCPQVKRVMNGVFQSLRGEFDLNETYSGSAVLRVLVNTIKVCVSLCSQSDIQTPPAADRHVTVCFPPFTERHTAAPHQT